MVSTKSSSSCFRDFVANGVSSRPDATPNATTKHEGPKKNYGMEPERSASCIPHYGLGTTNISGQLARGGGYDAVVVARTISDAMNAYPESLG
jgi:hypothetical protein